MNCLKCGKEIKDNQVFCPHCLDSMDAYPVKPDTHVHIPNRVPKPLPKKTWVKRRIRSQEEQLLHMRKTVRILVALVLFLTLILTFTCAALTHTLLNQENPNLGRNYTYESTGE